MVLLWRHHIAADLSESDRDLVTHDTINLNHNATWPHPDRQEVRGIHCLYNVCACVSVCVCDCVVVYVCVLVCVCVD